MLDVAYDSHGRCQGDDYVTELKGKGVTFIKLSPTEWTRFKSKFKEVHTKFVAENPKALEGLIKAVEATR